MAVPNQILPNYTYDDYMQWEGRWELIDGIPYAMSPAPTPRHQLIANNLGSELRIALKKCKRCKVVQFIDFKISERTILQPDVSILCDPATKAFVDFAPALVAEILSPSTALKDRHTKMGLYGTQGVKYCLIVDPKTEEVEVYELEDAAYTMKDKGHQFVFTFKFDDCTAEINFGEVWS